MLKLAIVQFKPEFLEVEKNLNKILELIDNETADLFVFPEFAFTGYAFERFEELKEVAVYAGEGKTFEFFKKLAWKKEAVMVYGFPEKGNDGNFYNSAMILFPNGEFRIYRKSHLFFREKKFFKPGDTGFFTFDYKSIKFGVAICFDWFFPETFRTLALKGADVILHPSNLVMPYSQEANIYSALQNKVYIATANRWGNERGFSFTGKSQLVNPKGEVIFRFPAVGDMVKTFLIDEKLSRDKHLNYYNDIFKERRKEFYEI